MTEEEAARKDTEVRISTMKVLTELAQLPGSLANTHSDGINDALLHLGAYKDLEMHPDFEEEFEDRLALTKESLNSLYTGALAQEEDAQRAIKENGESGG